MTSKVYFTKEISPEILIKIYEKLWVALKWKIWVKVSTWERGSKWYLKADLIAPLVKKLNGTIIECNTAYEGERNTSEKHLKTLERHGWNKYFDVDLMDIEDDDLVLEVNRDLLSLLHPKSGKISIFQSLLPAA